MKVIVLICALMTGSFTYAATYYISPTGDDSNPGDNILTPWASWERISAPRWSNILQAGDVVYIMGGVYQSPHTTVPSEVAACYWQDINGDPGNYITIQNYPGENPVLDCSNVAIPTYPNPYIIIMLNCSYVHVKGLHLKNLRQVCCDQGFSRGFELNGCSNCILEQIEVDHIGGSGFLCIESDDILYKNCDAHHNSDPESTGSQGAYGSADGFSRSNTGGTRCVYDGCRAWLNSDDGWDNLLSNGDITFHNCWAFWNGYYEPIPGGGFICAGDGNGYKLGPPMDNSKSSTITRFLNNCLAFENRYAGFNQNGIAPTGEGTLYQVYNCTAYKNGSADGDCQGNQFWYDYGFDFGYIGVSGAKAFTFKNNISYDNYLPHPFPAAPNPLGSDFRYWAANTNNDHNSWDGFQQTGGIYNLQWANGTNVTDNDFLSISAVGMDGLRQADGSLPNHDFLHLKSSSALSDGGVYVGLPFTGLAPDIGAFEIKAATGLNLKLFLQGYYDVNSSKMQPVLMNQNVGTKMAETDIITVELHDPATYATIATANGILNNDGSVYVGFITALTYPYFIAIKHRNTIETWSADPVTPGNTPLVYDFTTAANKAYGDNMIQIDSVWEMYTGDFNQDGFIDANDFAAYDIDASVGVSGEYVETDFNGDGFVDGNDFPIFDVNSQNGVHTIHP